MLTLATNACATDDLRVGLAIPSWVRTFGARLSEIVVVLDEQVPEGRQVDLHGGAPSLDRVRAELDRLCRAYPILRVVPLRRGEATDRALARWFGRDRPWRCQCGSTIVGYVLAVESARTDLVLKADCDMVFHENGWFDEARRLLESGEFDAIEPPRLGWDLSRPDTAFSTRAFLLSRERFALRLLPMKAHRLDWARRIHRRLHKRPTWLPLEGMLEKEREAGRVRWRVLDPSLGYALHLPTRADAALPWIGRVVECVESGQIPQAQVASGPNFDASLWPHQSPRPGNDPR